MLNTIAFKGLLLFVCLQWIVSVSAQNTTLVSDPLYWEVVLDPANPIQMGSASAACQALEDEYENLWGFPSYYDSGEENPDACGGGGMVEQNFMGSILEGQCEIAYEYDYCGEVEAIPEFNSYHSINATCMSGYSFDASVGACVATQPLVEDDVPDLGPPEECAPGNPINPANGNKLQTEIDYLSGAVSALPITRTYNSLADQVPTDFQEAGINGQRWHHGLDFQAVTVSVDRLVGSIEIPTLVRVILIRGDGARLSFSVEKDENDEIIWSSTLRGRHNALETVEVISGTTVEYRRPDGAIETYQYSSTQGSFTWMSLESIVYMDGSSATFSYDQNNKLTSVTQDPGAEYTLAYDSNDRINLITVPTGDIVYEYDSIGNLESVTFPDGNDRTYVYEDTNFPHALTGIIDENSIRLSTYAYDSQERGVLTKRAGDTNMYTFVYNGSLETDVTDPYGETITYQHQIVNGRALRTGVSNLSSTCSSTSIDKYFDAFNGKLSYETDGNGNTTNYEYENDGKTIIVTNGLSEITVYDYLDAARLNTATNDKTELEFSYNTELQQVSKTVRDLSTNEEQIWTYTYNTEGRIASIDGPRTDVTDTTSFTYYTNGDLHTVTNALQQVTTYSNYTADGRAGKITEPSGLELDFTYTTRGWLDTSAREGITTEYDYDLAGNLTQVTYPGLETIVYVYDDAQRLTEIHDHDGNYVIYTLDGMGNRTNTEIFNSTDSLFYTQTQVFNYLGQLQEIVGAFNQSTEHEYDQNGNISGITDGIGNHVTYYYDEVNRFQSGILDSSGASTDLSYDANGMPLDVYDFGYNQTAYVYNGLMQLTELTSPDTGISTFVYDEASNIAETTDADGRVLSFTYDALNRLNNISGNGYQVDYGYDEELNSVGKLGSIDDDSGQTKWLYDNKGFVQEKTQVLNGSVTLSTEYTVDTVGRLSMLTYPSGNVVEYLYASNGQVESLKVNNTTQISSITYAPFGSISGWLPANSVAYERVYNLDGLISDITYPTTIKEYEYDDSNQILEITDTNLSVNSESMTYDYAGRLESYSRAGTLVEWEYDDNGNRSAEYSGNISRTMTISNNQITEVYRDDLGVTERNISYDSAGHRVMDNNVEYEYNEAGRLVHILDNGNTIASYEYNGLGQRVSKTSNGQTAKFAYNEQGQLIGEYWSNGTSLEYIWLNETPVLMIQVDASNTEVYYIHPDHLNTPRVLSDSSGDVVWRWDGDAFGQGLANEDPDNDSNIVTLNLRFPGQYFDSETNTHYNYFRDYDPTLGRYIQSDPSGLNGGLNTYGYVDQNPLLGVDLFGLVNAVRAGVVIRVGWQNANNHNSGLGWRVTIQAPDGSYDQYGHMDPNTTPPVGTQCEAGDYIGDYANPTNGSSTGPHVHHERRDAEGNIINPGTASPIPNGTNTAPFGQTDNAHPTPHQGNDWVETSD